MEFKTILNTRKSIRSYTGEKISEETLHAILEAGQASPVGMAYYDKVHLTVVEDEDILKEVESEAQALYKAEGQPFLHGAPTYIIVSAAGEGNLHFSNAAIVAHQMSLAAVDLGVGTCHIWGATMALQENEELKKELAIPEGFIPCCGIILGATDEEYTERDDLSGRISVNRI